ESGIVANYIQEADRFEIELTIDIEFSQVLSQPHPQCWTGFSGQLPGTCLIMQQQNIGKSQRPEGCPAWNQNCGRIAAASSFCKNVSHCKRRCRCKNNESFRPGKIGKPHSCTGQNRCSNGSFDDRPIKKIDRCKKQCNVRCLAHYFTGEISQGAPGYG